MRAHTGGTGYAAVAKGVEHADGRMVTMLEKMPSGKTAHDGNLLTFHTVRKFRKLAY